HFVDGQRGDCDLSANGVICDPGGPALATGLPSAEAGGPYTVTEGESLLLDGSRSTDSNQPAASLRYEWDLDGDGIFGETGTAAHRGNETGPRPIFSAAGLAGSGNFTVTLRVTDNAGLRSTASALIHVTGVTPPVTVVSPPVAVADAYALRA